MTKLNPLLIENVGRFTGCRMRWPWPTVWRAGDDRALLHERGPSWGASQAAQAIWPGTKTLWIRLCMRWLSICT